ncbi:MgtC/SapB family protein [Tautonia rosea]|uniref:MgtC/SapB family protein n=1 Tax=Tautonia rosea TaxID=2728037 RepID=UPI0014742274|nr:MgtC/SapB family protein [Tautonia rosea]
MIDAFWQLLVDAIGPDLAEFGEVSRLIQTMFRLGIAALLGGVLGLERTLRSRSAGMRTFMLVAVGSAAFVLIAELIGISGGDLSRVVQGLLTGVGFLGAGVIFRSSDRSHAHGLTTAAGIWLTASLGMAVGFGRPASALLITLLALLILSPFGRRLELAIKARTRRQQK